MAALIGLLILLVVLVAIVMSVLHVSAGWAWIIVLAGIAALVVVSSRNARTRRVTQLGVFRSKCPYCKKAVKSNASICPHCHSALVVAATPPVALEGAPGTSGAGIESRLRTLDELKAKGAISVDEYSERRTALLAEI